MQRFGYLKYVYSTFGYEKTEEIAVTDTRAIEILIEMLLKNKANNEAYSVYLRNEKKISKWSIKNRFAKGKGRKLKYLESSIKTKDAFLPQAVINDKSLMDTYLKISDFGMTEADVMFIDRNNVEQLGDLFQSEAVLGLDSEFHDTDCSNFSQTNVALLQVASKDKCAIFDCIQLKNNQTFVDWLRNVFKSKSICKIGHSFDGDIKILNSTFGTDFEIENLINIDQLMISKSKMGLKNMVKLCLNKDFCKFNQISGWSVRPLRKAQLHYAALDAVVLHSIFDYLQKNKDDLSILDKS